MSYFDSIRSPDPEDVPASDRPTFGKLLRQLRLSAGLSQEALAERAQMSADGIGALERGDRRSPYRETVNLLAKGLSLAAADRARLEAAAVRLPRPRFREVRRAVAQYERLPTAPTSLLGRDADLNRLRHLVETCRVVTLVGAGGVGKTRVAVELGAQMAKTVDGGACLVELGPLQDASSVMAAIALTLKLGDSPNRTALEAIVSHVRDTEILIVLDNCEHVVADAACSVDALQRRCAHIRILATSREPLRIAGEQVYRLDPLPVPTPEVRKAITASQAITYDSIALFSERARGITHSFTLDDKNAETVANICSRLDGIPLAIELAAARVNVLTPKAIERSLDQRFRTLPPNKRGSISRHQTLRSLIDWSYHLLSDRERQLFRWLGVFANGFALEGAVSLGSAISLDRFEVCDVLASLVDKSLVTGDPCGDTLRYRLLESTREYARERLDEANETRFCAEHRLRYLRDRFASARAAYDCTARWAELDNALALELEDVRLSLDWAARGSMISIAAELLASIGGRWSTLGLENEATNRLEVFVKALSGGDSRLLATLWSEIANNDGVSGRTIRCVEAATTALVHARACSDSSILARALQIFATCNARSGRLVDPEVALAEAEAIPGLSVGVRLQLLSCRAMVSGANGKHVEAVRAYEQLLSEHRARGNSAAARSEIANLAEAEHIGGNTERAILIINDALPEAQGCSDRHMFVAMLTNLAGYCLYLNKLPEAFAAAREGIFEAVQIDARHSVFAMGLEHLALAYLLSDDPMRAALMYGYAGALLRTNGYERGYTEKMTYERLARLLPQLLSELELFRKITDGESLTTEAIVALALD